MTCSLSFTGQGDSCKESARSWHLSCSWIIHFLLISLFTDISCSEWGSQVLQQTNKSKVHQMWRKAAALEKGLFESTPLGKGLLSLAEQNGDHSGKWEVPSMLYKFIWKYGNSLYPHLSYMILLHWRTLAPKPYSDINMASETFQW